MPNPNHPTFNPDTLNITDLTNLAQFTTVVIDILESTLSILRQRSYSRRSYITDLIYEAEQFTNAWKRAQGQSSDFTDDDLEL